jgi:hypothetical protein
MHQNTQTGKKVEFWPNTWVIKDLNNQFSAVATGFVDHNSKLYKIDKFYASSPDSHAFIAHIDNVSKLWHERFGHHKYRSL